MPKPSTPSTAPGLKRAWRIVQNVMIEAERVHNDRAAAWLDVVCKQIEDELQCSPAALIEDLAQRRRRLAARMPQ